MSTLIGKVINNIYNYPTIIKRDSKNRERLYIIKVRLVKNEQKLKINFDIDDTLTLPFKESKNVIAQIWTETGIKNMKITRSQPTYIKKGKNIGRSNETTVYTQALFVCNSRYKKNLGTQNVNLFYPFAVHKYDKKPQDEKKHIRYPVAVQRKLDGVRVVAYKKGLYSRRLKHIEAKHIVDDLKQIFKCKKYSNLYLDGEFYKHGLSLQRISGLSRRQKSKSIIKLEFHIFDLFDPVVKTELSFEQRNALLIEIFSKFKFKYCVKVETIIAKDKNIEDKLYDQFLNEKYEGSIVRNMDMPYEFSNIKEVRSYQARKRKPRYSADFKVIGYTQGTAGKDLGAIIFEMITQTGIKFTATPVGMTYNERYELYELLTRTPDIFKKDYKDKLMIVEYDDISQDGVPLRAKSKSIRVD